MSGEHEQQAERLRLVVLLSGSGRSLDNLLQAIARDELDADIVAVASSKACRSGRYGSPVAARSEDKRDLPIGQSDSLK